jgi:hypothetical protein
VTRIDGKPPKQHVRSILDHNQLVVFNQLLIYYSTDLSTGLTTILVHNCAKVRSWHRGRQAAVLFFSGAGDSDGKISFFIKGLDFIAKSR